MTLQKTPGGIWSDEEMLEDDEEASLHIEDSPVASSLVTETSTKSLSSIILGQSQPGQKFYGISAEDRELRIALKVSMLLTCVCLLLAPIHFLFAEDENGTEADPAGDNIARRLSPTGLLDTVFLIASYNVFQALESSSIAQTFSTPTGRPVASPSTVQVVCASRLLFSKIIFPT